MCKNGCEKQVGPIHEKRGCVRFLELDLLLRSGSRLKLVWIFNNIFFLEDFIQGAFYSGHFFFGIFGFNIVNAAATLHNELSF